jgi:hypothetical protein
MRRSLKEKAVDYTPLESLVLAGSHTYPFHSPCSGKKPPFLGSKRLHESRRG